MSLKHNILTPVFISSCIFFSGGSFAADLTTDAKSLQQNLKIANQQVGNFLRKLSTDKNFASEYQSAMKENSNSNLKNLLKEGGINVPTKIEPTGTGIKITIRIKKPPIIIVIGKKSLQ